MFVSVEQRERNAGGNVPEALPQAPAVTSITYGTDSVLFVVKTVLRRSQNTPCDLEVAVKMVGTAKIVDNKEAILLKRCKSSEQWKCC